MTYRTGRRSVDIEFLRGLVTWYRENDLEIPMKIRNILDSLSEYWP